MKSIIKNITKTALALSIASASFMASSDSIWEVKKGDDVLHIGGTVHILPNSEFPLPTNYTDIYANADSIVLETKLPEPGDQAMQMEMMKAMSYEEGKKLTDLISKESHAELVSYFAKVGMDYSNLERFKVGFLNSMVVMIEANKGGIAGQGVDAYFSQLATQDKKEIEYLETMEFQLNMLAGMGEGDEETAIKHLLEGADNTVPLLKDLIKAWRAGDEDTLVKLAIVELKEKFPQSYKALLTDRNNNWVPKIEAMFGDDDREFVLVGAAHLVGEESVIKSLKDKGYTVTKL